MRKMYIPLALVFLFFYQISVKAQTVLPDEVLVTYQCYNKPLKQVLKDLAALTNVSIVYSENKIPANKPVFVKASKESLGDVLTVVPVSYTHLDVYKRQEHMLSVMTLWVRKEK